MKFTRIVSSDLKLAMDSAQIIADKLNIPVITHRFPLSKIEEAYRIFENKEEA